MQVQEFILHEIHKAPRANGTANLPARFPLPEPHVTRFTEEIINSFKTRPEPDRGIERCYRKDISIADRERVEHLFRLYEKLTAQLLSIPPKRAKKSAGRYS